MENNLNQTYWNELRAKYPEALSAFGKWLLVYMDEVKWERWFGHGRGIMFWDIPLEMQRGIFERYKRELEYKVSGTPIERIVPDLLFLSQGSIAKFFELEQEKEKQQSQFVKTSLLPYKFTVISTGGKPEIVRLLNPAQCMIMENFDNSKNISIRWDVKGHEADGYKWLLKIIEERTLNLGMIEIKSSNENQLGQDYLFMDDYNRVQSKIHFKGSADGVYSSIINRPIYSDTELIYTQLPNTELQFLLYAQSNSHQSHDWTSKKFVEERPVIGGLKQ